MPTRARLRPTRDRPTGVARPSRARDGRRAADAAGHSARRQTSRTRRRRGSIFSTPSERRKASRSSTVAAVLKKRRFAPIAFAQLETAPLVGTARSLLPICCCRSGQRNAPGPVPRWSNTIIRYPLVTFLSRDETLCAKGSPGWPGPPVRKTRTPREASTFCLATRSANVPATAPLRSSGTVSIEQVNPPASGHAFAALAVGTPGRRPTASPPSVEAAAATDTHKEKAARLLRTSG